MLVIGRVYPFPDSFPNDQVYTQVYTKVGSVRYGPHLCPLFFEQFDHYRITIGCRGVTIVYE